MISLLKIKNVALAGSTTVEFGPGLNVITGETGAGKSILIGALGLLLGNRADKSLIRSGEDACGAEALFSLKDVDALNELLTEYGIEPCEDGQLIVRRIVKMEGAGQNWVNGSPVTLQVLKKLGDYLVDIHGPHDHQSLLAPETQLEILDAFGHLWKEREDYEEQYEVLRSLDKKIDELTGNAEDFAEQMDRLTYRIKEIEEADLEDNEEEQLLREHTLLGNAQRIQELGNEAVVGLMEGDETVFDRLSACRQSVRRLQGLLPDADAWLDEMDRIIIQVQELNNDMSGVLSEISHSPERLAWLDERLALFQKLKHKYGPEIEDVMRVFEEASERLRELEGREERLRELEQEKKAVYTQLEKAAEALRIKRMEAAEQLSADVQRELQALGLKDSRFTTAFTQTEPRPVGMDSIEFEFAPNKGENKQPLRLTASSGEMSRVMLAVKTVLAAHDRIPVLVFDEIDSNVGGETASAVGAKLQDVSANHQVICITHFPQVAVFGKTHLAVEKYQENGRTFSGVRTLDAEERVEEIARMLGGRDLTASTLAHARELIECVPQRKKNAKKGKA
jgi:DNA repair protein RecN (Recombination protein N)